MMQPFLHPHPINCRHASVASVRVVQHIPKPNLTTAALVCKSSSGPNRSRLGRQLSWCVFWGLLELVGWPLFICHCGWRDAYKPHWHVPGCWFDRRARQRNAPVDPCSHLQLKWSAWQPMCRKLWRPHHKLSMFLTLLSPTPNEAWHGVTPSGGVEEWQPSALARSQCHSHLVSCQVPEVLSCGN